MHVSPSSLSFQGTLEVLMFSTPLCDACANGTWRLPLAADCACAQGVQYELQVGVASASFALVQDALARALATQLGLVPPQVLLWNASAVGDETNVLLELLPLLPPWLSDEDVLNLTTRLLASTGVAAWSRLYGGITVRCDARFGWDGRRTRSKA
jgi:hypothetical protein